MTPLEQNKEAAAILKQTRKRMGLTQEQFAERYSPYVSLQTLKRWESAKTAIPAHFLLRLGLIKQVEVCPTCGQIIED